MPNVDADLLGVLLDLDDDLDLLFQKHVLAVDPEDVPTVRDWIEAHMARWWTEA